MADIPISASVLERALAKHIAKASYGISTMNIAKIRGVTKTGESFEIESLEIEAYPKGSARSTDMSGASAPRQHAGKLRLAAVDGVALS
jgi:hypothetical protein